MVRALEWIFRKENRVESVVRRLLATAILIGVGFAVLPQAGVPYPLVKIALLCAAELGLIGVMLGMFFGSKTYFAGVQLFTGAMAMLALASHHHQYSAAVVGLIAVAIGIFDLLAARRPAPAPPSTELSA